MTGPVYATSGDEEVTLSASARSPDAVREGTAEGRCGAWLIVALALLWLVFLVYPLVTLVGARADLARLVVPATGGAFTVALYVWAVTRSAFSPSDHRPWVALALLLGLALVLPLVYGRDWFGGFLYVAIVAGLALPPRAASAAALALAVLAALIGTVVGSAWWATVSIAALTGIGGLVTAGVTWLIALNRALRAARAEIARLAAAAERVRLARDLHDAVKQQTFVTAMEIGAARALLDHDPHGAKDHLAEAEVVNRRVQAELNALIHQLRPAPLQDRGLAAALRAEVDAWSRQSGIHADLRIQGARARAPDAEQALVRVAQEALANVARHSGATAAVVALEWGRDAVTLRVRDNGGGFVPAEATGVGHGLRNMRERVAARGGRLTVESAPGAGTRVTAVCLLDTARETRRRRGWTIP